MPDENVSSLLKNRSIDVGEFSASVEGRKFLETEDVILHEAGQNYFIVGNDNNVNFVAFSVPSHLVGDGPHSVKHYEGGLRWQVKIDNKTRDVVSGSTIVTFSYKRRVAKGTIDFVLDDGRKVTGAFDILNLQSSDEV